MWRFVLAWCAMSTHSFSFPYIKHTFLVCIWKKEGKSPFYYKKYIFDRLVVITYLDTLKMDEHIHET